MIIRSAPHASSLCLEPDHTLNIKHGFGELQRQNDATLVPIDDRREPRANL